MGWKLVVMEQIVHFVLMLDFEELILVSITLEKNLMEESDSKSKDYY